MNPTTIDIAQSNSAEYQHIRENNDMVWAFTPGNSSILAIAVGSVPSSAFISPSLSAAKLGSDEYIVSGYLGTMASRQLGFEDPHQAGILSNLASLGKPARAQWVYVTSDDQMPAKLERPEGEIFAQRFNNSLTALKSTQLLEPNWDSYGATKPPTGAIARSFNVLWSLNEQFANVGESLPEPFVTPALDGRIQFEWEAGNIEFEVTIDEQGEMEYLLSETTREDKFKEGILSTEKELGDMLLSTVFKKGI